MHCSSAPHDQQKLAKREQKHGHFLHTRKPSLSHSVSSASSSTSARSTHSSDHGHRHGEPVEFDPLSLHPTFHPPPRLYDRPFIVSDHGDGERYQDVEVLEEDYFQDQPEEKSAEQELQLPPVDSPTPSNHTGHDRNEASDYFMYKMEQLEERPQLPRSHWSESTIQTLDQMTPQIPEREIRHSQWQNFSYKRNTVPRRPPMKTMDSVDDFIKRGGWKRRGIVFQQEDGNRSAESLF